MTTYFVTRHPGALEWAAVEGVIVDRVLAHFDPECTQPGDVVLGTLPINLAARVCARGGRYLHLSVEVPPEWRGRGLHLWVGQRRTGAGQCLRRGRSQSDGRGVAPGQPRSVAGSV